MLLPGVLNRLAGSFCFIPFPWVLGMAKTRGFKPNSVGQSSPPPAPRIKATQKQVDAPPCGSRLAIDVAWFEGTGLT